MFSGSITRYTAPFLMLYRQCTSINKDGGEKYIEGVKQTMVHLFEETNFSNQRIALTFVSFETNPMEMVPAHWMYQLKRRNKVKVRNWNVFFSMLPKDKASRPGCLHLAISSCLRQLFLLCPAENPHHVNGPPFCGPFIIPQFPFTCNNY